MGKVCSYTFFQHIDKKNNLFLCWWGGAPGTAPGTEKELQYRGEQWMPRFIIIEISELLDTQEESEDELRSEEGGPLGECTGTVTECGEHGNRKKINAEDKKIR